VPAARSFARRGPVDDDYDDERLCNASDEENTPRTAPGPALPGSMAGLTSTLPVQKKRRGAATTGCSPPIPSLTRRGWTPGAGGTAAGSGASVAEGGSASIGAGASQQPRAGLLAGTTRHSPGSGAASPRTRGVSAAPNRATPPARAGRASSAAAAGGISAGPAAVAHVVDIVKTTGVRISGVRREITTERKEVDIMSSQLRAVTKKVDDFAVLEDRLTASLVFQHRTLASSSGNITSVLTQRAENQADASPPATRDTEGGAGEIMGGCAAAESAQTPGMTEEQDAQWVLDLKVCSCSTGTTSGTASEL